MDAQLNHANRGWRSRWTVSLTDCTATHRDGWVFRFKRTDDPDSIDGERIAQPEPMTPERMRVATRVAGEAGEIYSEALRD